MKLQFVYARFYKSFNFDHLRKAHQGYKPDPWDHFSGSSYPYIRIPIDSLITTIVGANESGKSHLLSAIEKAVTGEGFEQRDICRYSPFFNVEKGQTCWPHLGLAWSDLTKIESQQVRSAAGIQGDPEFDRFLMFREGPDRLVIHTPVGDGWQESVLSGNDARIFGRDFLPQPFRIQAEIALPNSVPLDFLLNPTKANAALASSSERSRLIETAQAVGQHWATDQNAFAQAAPKLHQTLIPMFDGAAKAIKRVSDGQYQSLLLARSLLLELASVEPARLAELSLAIKEGAEGHANALISKINQQLARRLNFPKYWAQDRDFSLQVSLRETELVFTIRDRTGTEYTFAERSNGLKYFLSYLIQSQIHENATGRSEILLMDEPDAYLSAEAQQDLLKIFARFASPPQGVPPVQVVYVTHSPFLIDKNNAERIRVLQKGKGFDGTRVVRNVSRNHYEPLRSAFGAFVGETAFIGACNLVVEGVSDQVILAGVARLVQSSSLEDERLDLNRVTIVPCGSASQAPYMVYLIRGRDAEKPPVVVLLDSDSAGNDAAKLLKGGDKKLKRLIDPAYIIQIGEVGGAGVNCIEDFVPRDLAIAAANHCLAEIAEFREQQNVTLGEDDLRNHSGLSLFEAISAAASVRGTNIDKLAFARALVSVCVDSSGELAGATGDFIAKIQQLFMRLNKARRSAEREKLRDSVGALVDRQQSLFVCDFPSEATCEQALHLIEQLGDILDDSVESDAVRIKLLAMRRDFKLDDKPRENVTGYADFKADLGALKSQFEINRLDTA